jgi:hypothetical protein
MEQMKWKKSPEEVASEEFYTAILDFDDMDTASNSLILKPRNATDIQKNERFFEKIKEKLRTLEAVHEKIKEMHS